MKPCLSLTRFEAGQATMLPHKLNQIGVRVQFIQNAFIFLS